MSHEVSRRDVVKLAAALAAGSGMATADSALGQQASKPANAADRGKGADELLALAKQSPEAFMLSEPEIFALDTDGRSRDLVITSARDEKGNQVEVRVKSRSVRIFRADPTVDEFTSRGGVYWRFRDKPGKVNLRNSSEFNQVTFSPIVMVVRDDQTVRVYTLSPDLRC